MGAASLAPSQTDALPCLALLRHNERLQNRPMQCIVHTASLAQVRFKQYSEAKDSVAVYADTLLKGVLDVRSGLVTDLSLKG